MELPKIISVDDHVVEPPGVWQDRLPKDRTEWTPSTALSADQRELALASLSLSIAGVPEIKFTEILGLSKLPAVRATD